MIGITPGFEPQAAALCLSLSESGPVSVAEFDDAWTPAGENYRDELLAGGLITIGEVEREPGETEAEIALTGAGVALALDQAPVQPAVVPKP